MKRRLSELFLWLFVLDLGIALGAGLYEARVVAPAWMGTLPQTWPNTGLLFWVYVTTMPLTLLTIANAVLAWRSSGPERRWWLGAVAVVLVERIATFTYFIPTMVGLQAMGGAAQAQVDAALSQWLLVNHARHPLTLAAFLMGLKVVSLRGGRP